MRGSRRDEAILAVSSLRKIVKKINSNMSVMMSLRNQENYMAECIDICIRQCLGCVVRGILLNAVYTGHGIRQN